MKRILSSATIAAALLIVPVNLRASSTITGDYVEVRSCDVYTGPCFANAEVGLAGKEGILIWSVREGSWNNAALDGLSVIAVVRTDKTLGDLRYEPQSGTAVVITDARADAAQKAALVAFARSMSGGLIGSIAEVKTASIESVVGACAKSGCARVKAGDLLEVSTRCLGGHDHLCGNEYNYYPPLTKVEGAVSAFTEVASYKGSGLNLTWESRGQRSAFLGTFAARPDESQSIQVAVAGY